MKPDSRINNYFDNADLYEPQSVHNEVREQEIDQEGEDYNNPVNRGEIQNNTFPSDDMEAAEINNLYDPNNNVN